MIFIKNKKIVIIIALFLLILSVLAISSEKNKNIKLIDNEPVENLENKDNEDIEEINDLNQNKIVVQNYNVDSGFKPEINGFSFRNTDYPSDGGVCGGMSAIVSAKYNGCKIDKEYTVNNKTYVPTNNYTWYNNIYGEESIHEIKLENNNFIIKNSPQFSLLEDGTASAYPMERFSNHNENDEVFFNLLKYYFIENNKTIFSIDETTIAKEIKYENDWKYIDFIANCLQQKKVVIVNFHPKYKTGHSIVGYKMEQIDKNTCRLYCYDNNCPDNMEFVSHIGNMSGKLKEDGTYEDFVWKPSESYIDFTRKTIEETNCEIFEITSSKFSFDINIKEDIISFGLYQNNQINIINYGVLKDVVFKTENQINEVERVQLFYDDMQQYNEVTLPAEYYKKDFDGDGLLNIEEVENNTNMYKIDTDNDGIKDYNEVHKIK